MGPNRHLFLILSLFRSLSVLAKEAVALAVLSLHFPLLSLTPGRVLP